MSARRTKGTGTLIDRSIGKWLIRIDYGRNALTGRRERRNVTFKGSKADAQKLMNRLLLERDKGTSVQPTKVTVGEWLLDWLTRHHAQGPITPRVRERYQGIIEQHLIPSMGHVRLQDLRPAHIAEMKSRWLTGESTSTAAKPLAPSTVYKHLVVLRQALEEAVHFGLLPTNPADSVSKPSVSGLREQRALTEDEIRELLGVAGGTRFDVPVRLTLSTGLRQSELLSLRWEHVELDSAVINVPGTKTANSRRQVELSARMVKLLRAHRASQREQRLRLRAGWLEGSLVFPNSFGAPWNRRIFYRDYKTLVARSGLTNLETITWHTLRHTAATQWIRHGADIFTVSRRLGHASAAFTMDVYAHLLKGQQRVAAEALDHLLA